MIFFANSNNGLSNSDNLFLLDASRRFFQSKTEEQSLKEKGKYSLKVTQQRRQNRIKRVSIFVASIYQNHYSVYKLFLLQKLDLRKSAFAKATVSEQQREIYSKVLVKSFISSEDSALEGSDGVQKTVLKVKPLPWRSSRVVKFYKKLDNKAASGKKSRQSMQQTLPRVVGDVSIRDKPLRFPNDFWGFQSPE